MDTQRIIISQYRAALEMLRSAIEACPEPLWGSPADKNRFWHIAYHTLFYTHLYLSRSEADFVPWEQSLPEYNFLGPLPWPPHPEPKIGEPYSRAAVLEYWQYVGDRVAELVRAVPLEEASSFPWVPLCRLELHFYNIRHIQHHAGQLIERIRRAGGGDFAWVGSRD